MRPRIMLASSAIHGFPPRWHSIKCEEVYVHACNTVGEACSGLARHIDFFDTRRLHTARDRRTPDAVYFDAMPLAAAA